MAILRGKTIKGLSNPANNKSRRQTKNIADQSDIRQSWSVRTNKTKDEQYQNQAERFDQLSQDWWTKQFVDRVVKGAQQFAGGYGTGYIFSGPIMILFLVK